MNTVCYEKYNKEKIKFFRKHKSCTELTSPMSADCSYHKEYVFEDGAVWYEVMSIENVPVEVEVKFCKVRQNIKMFRTEFWSSDDSISKYYYEQY